MKKSVSFWLYIKMVDYIHLYFSINVGITVQAVVFILFLFNIINVGGSMLF